MHPKRITKQNDKIVIQFPYDKEIIKVCRTLPSRRFDPVAKVWTIPAIHAKEAIKKLKTFGFEIDESVTKEIQKQEQEKKELEEIKHGNIKKEFTKVKAHLFDYQKAGVLFMLKCKNCILADQPGLGKTLQSITTAEENNAQKVLILCPSSLKENWKEEIRKWTNNKKAVVIEGTAAKRKKLWGADANYYIANYELLIRDDFDEMKKVDWDYIIADEATRISNPRAKSSRAIKRLTGKRRLALTGTPINNRPDDLWNIADFVRPGEMGSFWSFREKYCVLNKWGSVAAYKNLNDLREKIKRIMIRRTKEEVLKELPPKLKTDVFSELNKAERNYYNQLRNEMVANIMGNKIEAQNALTQMVRLKQLTSSLELLGGEGSSKLETLKELLQDIISNGNKVVVFTQFSKMSKIMQRELYMYNPLRIAGDVKETERQKLVHKFNNSEKHKVMIMTEAGAFGLNLQSASYVVHYDLSWSLSKMLQREDRCHRIGQKKNVTIYTLMARNTIDQYVRSVIWEKQKLSDFLIDTKDEMESLKLTKDDLLNLLA